MEITIKIYIIYQFFDFVNNYFNLHNQTCEYITVYQLAEAYVTGQNLHTGPWDLRGAPEQVWLTTLYLKVGLTTDDPGLKQYYSTMES